MASYNSLSKKPRKNRVRRNRVPKLLGRPFLKCICMKTFISTPRKPNSAVRRVATVRHPDTGNRILVSVPGHGTLAESYSVVLIRGGRANDLPGVRYKLVRYKYDFCSNDRFVRKNRRSKFGIPYRSDEEWESILKSS